MTKIKEIKDCKTVLEEANNELLTSEKVITKIRVKLQEGKDLTPDDKELIIAIMDTHLEEFKRIKKEILKLYKPYRVK